MSVGHESAPRRIPCILGSFDLGPQLCWREVSLTVDEIRDVAASRTRFLIAFLVEADLTNVTFPNRQQDPLQAFNIPPAIKNDLCIDASGFFKAAHCDSSEGDAGCYTTAFRFLIKYRSKTVPQRASPASVYSWEKLGFATFHPSAEFFTILCLDIGHDARTHLRAQILAGKLSAFKAHPLSIHVLLLGYILESFDRAVWSWRDVVRELETSRLHRSFATARDFDHMHEIARHLIHSTEMLTTALSVVECMINECEGAGSGSDSQASSACRRELHFVMSVMKALLHRSSALERRMENEIALVSDTQAFHTNAQHDTSIASQIALTSQRDGQTTKGISILGMLFLPGTYISALFSMSFFHFAPSADGGSEQWTVSPKFWMYWAVTIPVTALTVGIWFIVQRQHS